jgi:dTDP-4-dehydrorhamnose 3,5-epimerase
MLQSLLALMQVIETTLPGVLVLEPRMFEDARGFFFESYNQRVFQERTGVSPRFVQGNHSRSRKNVLRGLHYQIAQPQAKLVRVVAGAMFDVVVDLRRSSSAFGKWSGTLLSAENRRLVWVPEGFAHGFLVLSDSADVLYEMSDYYAPQHERCVLWSDPEIGIEWPLTGEAVIAAKDHAGLPLREAETFP